MELKPLSMNVRNTACTWQMEFKIWLLALFSKCSLLCLLLFFCSLVTYNCASGSFDMCNVVTLDNGLEEIRWPKSHNTVNRKKISEFGCLAFGIWKGFYVACKPIDRITQTSVPPSDVISLEPESRPLSIKPAFRQSWTHVH